MKIEWLKFNEKRTVALANQNGHFAATAVSDCPLRDKKFGNSEVSFGVTS